MKFELDNRVVSVHFHYSTDIGGHLHPGRSHLSLKHCRKYTECIVSIRKKDNDLNLDNVKNRFRPAKSSLLVTGISTCHPGELFVKNVGRKISLNRALSELPEELKDIKDQIKERYEQEFSERKSETKKMIQQIYESEGIPIVEPEENEEEIAA